MSTSETMMYGWNNIDWRKLERCAFKLQKRIYRASSQSDTKAVHTLQRLLIKSRAAAFLAVRQVAQDNTGKKTAGVDGIASLADAQKLSLAQIILSNPLAPKAKPVRRVWIPKPGKDEQRPLGIPVMEDRARQALVKMALEPEWEAKFEPNSYGFRPGRSCHDAVAAIFANIKSVPKYVLDADIAKCFDCISHEALLGKLETFPELQRTIRSWLKAGMMDGGELFPTSEGAPQGGVISPLLMNVALHGLAAAIEDSFQKFRNPRGQRRIPWKPTVIRYADDFVVLHRDLEAIKRVQQIAAEWLAGMGLEMKPSKTRITHTLQVVDGKPGFEFLGFHFRQYARGKNRCVHDTHGRPVGFSPNVKPSPASQKRFLRRIRDIVRNNRNVPHERLIQMLNPVIRGWGNYFSMAVSKDIFSKMDMCIFQKLWSWASFRHPKKSRRWIANKYWIHGDRGWVFGIDGKTALHKLSSIPTRRFVKVQGHRSPFDGDAIYWSTRMGRHPELRQSLATLLKRQEGRCPCCGLFFRPGDRLEYVHLCGDDDRRRPGPPAVVHDHCRNVA